MNEYKKRALEERRLLQLLRKMSISEKKRKKALKIITEGYEILNENHLYLSFNFRNDQLNPLHIWDKLVYYKEQHTWTHDLGLVYYSR
jgi:hypothetical protein